MLDYEQLHGFFDDYPAFYGTSGTIPSRNRLNSRYAALITTTASRLNGKRVLDIASHDGRWSFAALKAGASHVIGIEGRPHLVESSGSNIERYGVAREQYQFICGDVIDEIARLETGSLDVIFCFGFFYHTMFHMYLLSQIMRLNPECMILDTFISSSAQPIIQVLTEPVESDRNAVAYLGQTQEVAVGWPSRAALEIMLNQIDFSVSYIDWQSSNIGNWKDIEDYRDAQRISLIAENRRRPATRTS
jgi:2-polyprenyl-3-methyl-5-hydroxy-6-metoxy-1,4-benzoquinol methylase